MREMMTCTGLHNTSECVDMSSLAEFHSVRSKSQILILVDVVFPGYLDQAG